MNGSFPTLHIVSHTHWDREWYLTFQQFRLKLVHLVDGLLDILDSDPNFCSFMLDGQTIVLDDYLQIRPEREADLRRYIREGRITIGPWHVLPDEFLVSPEATVRNLMQGEHTGRAFGQKLMVGYNPDAFGHIGQLPQILRGFGFDSACVQRGLADEPCELWWQAPDGSRVFMAYMRDGYGNAADLPVANPERFAARLGSLRDSLRPHSAASHLLLMWGTDHTEPPPGSSAALAAARRNMNGEELVHSTLPRYVQAARDSLLDSQQLPVVQGELRSSKRHHLLPNVLSTRMWIKQRNHACETLLEKWDEPFSTWAEHAVPYAPLPPTYVRQPAVILRQAWRLLMENHPHDSICGCSIDAVADEMRPRFDQVEQIGEVIVAQSLERLAEGIHTLNDRLTVAASGAHNPELVPIVVFNPTAGPRSDQVEVALDLPPEMTEFQLVDETGVPLPYQTHGLGTRELINMQLSHDDFRRLSGLVTDGNIEGMALQGVKTRREESNVFIEVLLSDKYAPSAAAWENALRQIRPLVEDPAVKTFFIHATSLSTTRIRFSAPDVPGYGYRTFWLRGRAAAARAPQRLNPLVRALLPLAARLAKIQLVQKSLTRLARRSPRPANRIENDFLRLEAAADGTLTLLDKRTGVIYPGLNAFEDGGDRGDEYNYAPPPKDRICIARLKGVQVESNPVCQTLVLSLELAVPAALASGRESRSDNEVTLPITTRATLTRGVPRLDIRTEVENKACDHRLRVVCPAPFRVNEASYDGHFEVVQRPVGLPAYDESWAEQPRPEVPQRAFTSISDGKTGLVIANRGLPEVEVKEVSETHSGIALTLLRCVGWLSRDDFSARNGQAGPFAVPAPGAQMIGKWSFDYSVIPCGTDRMAAWQQAYAFQAPLRGVLTSLHGGELPGRGAFLQVQPAEFVVSAVKAAEDADGWLVRGYNISDREIPVTLKPWKPFQRAERANLAEESTGSLQPGEDGSISLTARAHEIVTLLLRD